MHIDIINAIYRQSYLKTLLQNIQYFHYYAYFIEIMREVDTNKASDNTLWSFIATAIS